MNNKTKPGMLVLLLLAVCASMTFVFAAAHDIAAQPANELYEIGDKIEIDTRTGEYKRRV